jgi:hypothetical protein
VRRLDGAALVDVPVATLGASHDSFAIYVAIDPDPGAFALAAYALLSAGTAAAGWYWKNVVARTLPTWTSAWALIEWTDTDADGQPSAGDTFTTIASWP